jgi:adenylylsulfate kinase
MAGAGKSTIAQALANRLRRLGKFPELLDGAEVESLLGVGRAQNKDERNAETRKLVWLARMVTRSGGVVLQSAIESPYRETREEARRQINRFVEVFVDCPTDVLVQRDKTGNYKKALAGEIKNLVGITEPYEPPKHAEVVVDTSKHTVDQAVDHIVEQLVALRFYDPASAGLKSRPRAVATPKALPKPPPVKIAPPPRPAAAKPAKVQAVPKPAAKAKPVKLAAKPKAKAETKRLPAKAKVLHARRGAAAKAPARPAARAAHVKRAAGGKKR